MLTGDKLGQTRTFVGRGSLRLDPTDNLNILIRSEYSEGRDTGKLQKLNGLTTAGIANLESALEGSVTPAQQAAIFAVLLGGTSPAQLAAYGAALAASRANVFRSVPAGRYESSLQSQRIDLKAASGSGTISLDLGGPTIKTITAYSWLNKIYNSDPDGTRFRILDNQRSTVEYRQFTQELQITGQTLNDQLTYAAGVFYYHADGQDTSSTVAIPAVLNNNVPGISEGGVNNKSIAGYAQITYRPFERLGITVGARQTHETKAYTARNLGGPTLSVCNVPPPASLPTCRATFRTKYNNFSFTGGLDYQVRDGTLIYAKVSRGFKAGGTNPRTTSNPVSVTAFKPEIVTQYEAGVKADLLDRHLRINLAAYKTDYKGVQLTTVVASPGGVTSIISNVVNGVANKAKIDGVELEITAKPIDGLTLSGSYAYTDARFKSGQAAGNVENLFPNLSKHQASAALVYELPVSYGNIQFGANYSYRSKVDFQPNNHGNPATQAAALAEAPASLSQQKGYGLLDARISTHIEDGDIDVAVFGRNLTKKYYKVGSLDLVGAGFGLVQSYYSDPRSYGIEVTKRF